LDKSARGLVVYVYFQYEWDGKAAFNQWEQNVKGEEDPEESCVVAKVVLTEWEVVEHAWDFF